MKMSDVMYPWPFGEFDGVMDDALDIAMDYLIRTGQAVKLQEAQKTAAHAIAVAWRSGVNRPGFAGGSNS
jgi:hypothetical protein